MKSYRCGEIAQLSHELSLSPLRHRLRQVAGIKRAIDLIEPHREYPYTFVCYHITGYHSRRAQDVLLNGKDLITDLIKLLDALTTEHPLPVQASSGELYDGDALATRFNVSTKTIARWRKRGLAGCWYVNDGPKPRRFVYAGRDVERFIAQNLDLVRRGATFQFMGREEKERLIARARELAASEKCGLHVATVLLSEETGRAVETIRYTLRRFDHENPAEALFDKAEQPQEVDEKQVIFQAYLDGDSVAALAERFGKRDSAIRRILATARAAQLLAGPISYMHNGSFDAPNAAALMRRDDAQAPIGARDDEPDVSLTRVPAELPPYLRDLYRTPLLTPTEEASLFRKMNFLLHQAETLRQALPADAAKVKAAAVAKIDKHIEQAGEIKNRIIQANLRLVVSIAKRHIRSAAGRGLFELVSDGNIALMRAVDKFDYARGFRFSTYATWAIRRSFARSIPEEMTQVARFQTGHDELLATAGDHREPEDDIGVADDAKIRTVVLGVLQTLDGRERSIVERRFGLGDGIDAGTLAEISEEFGICKERVRQIERRALRKLRESLGDRAAELLAG